MCVYMRHKTRKQHKRHTTREANKHGNPNAYVCMCSYTQVYTNVYRHI